jgi:hypothetical protein
LIFARGLLPLHTPRLKQKPVSKFDFLVSAVIYAFFIAGLCLA